MNAIEFKELLKARDDYKKILYDYANLKINLTSKQIDKILKLKSEKEAILWKN